MRRRGEDPEAAKTAAGTIETKPPRGTALVLRPQNKAAKSGVFSLAAERRGDETHHLKDLFFHKTNNNKNFYDYEQ